MSYATTIPEVPTTFYGPIGAPPEPTVEGAGEVAGGVAVAVVVVGVVGLIGYLVYIHGKTMTTIAEKEGSTGLLKYSAGTAAIGVASQWLSPRRERNPRRRRRVRRKR